MGLQLLGLPSEVLILIFSLLPLPEINACKRSCRRLRAVIKQSGLLRCRIRTLKNHIEDLSPPGLSTADFLDSLRTWEKAWLTFNVGKEAATQTTFRPYQGFTDFLLRSGYLIQLCQGDSPGWSYMDLSRQRDLRGKISAAQWTDIQMNTNFFSMGWALDIDQDFVAVSRLSCGSFSSNGYEHSHPHMRIQRRVSGSEEGTRSSLQAFHYGNKSRIGNSPDDTVGLRRKLRILFRDLHRSYGLLPFGSRCARIPLSSLSNPISCRLGSRPSRMRKYTPHISSHQYGSLFYKFVLSAPTRGSGHIFPCPDFHIRGYLRFRA